MRIHIEPGGWALIAVLVGGGIWLGSRALISPRPAIDHSASAGLNEPLQGAESKSKAPAAAATTPRQIISQAVHFEINSAELKSADRAMLDKIAHELRRDPSSPIQIVGGADIYGEAEYNLELSRRRAESVREYLAQQHSMEGSRFELRWVGADQPVGDNRTREGRRQNRRAEIKLALK